MRRTLLNPLVAIGLILTLSDLSFGKVKRKLNIGQKKVPRLKVVVPRYQSNHFVGFDSMTGSSRMVMGAQFGVAFWKEKPFYLGPEVNFARFKPGSKIEVLGSAWYRVPVYKKPNLSFNLGALAGIGFTENITDVSATAPAGYLDLVLVHQVNPWTGLRAQLRPGIVDGKLAFMANLSVSFYYN